MATRLQRPVSPQRRQSNGVMLLALLIGLAIAGIALMGAVDVWTMQSKREREQQLLFVGDQYRLAIQRYYHGAPQGTPKTLPTSLSALLEDDRYPMPVRYLRRLYPDPMTGSIEWGEVRIGEGVAGVYSLSESAPVKQAGFSASDQSFTDQKSYQNWIFDFQGAQRSSTPAKEDMDTQQDTPPPFGLPQRPATGRKP